MIFVNPSRCLSSSIRKRFQTRSWPVTGIGSRQGKLPNTGLKAYACGTRLVAFDARGLEAIASDQQAGYLGNASDTTELDNTALGHANRKFLKCLACGMRRNPDSWSVKKTNAMY